MPRKKPRDLARQPPVEEREKLVTELVEEATSRIQATLRTELVEVVRAEYFSGPLPPPETLAAYSRAFDGCSERIVAMAESQQSHRHSMERGKLAADIAHERLGMQFTLVIAVVGVLAGAALLWANKDIAGYVSLSASLLTPIASRLLGERRQRKQLQERAQLAQRPPSRS